MTITVGDLVKTEGYGPVDNAWVVTNFHTGSNGIKHIEFARVVNTRNFMEKSIALEELSWVETVDPVVWLTHDKSCIRKWAKNYYTKERICEFQSLST